MKFYRKNLMQIEKIKKRKNKIRFLIFILLDIIISTHFISASLLNTSMLKITAHRGSCIFTPENTKASVLEAIALNVDCIEVDVQLSKDNQVILLHDSSFKRTTGIDVNPWALNYEDILNLNAGYYKDNVFYHAVPLLEEIIEICPSTITLNIELKNYGHSELLPEKVVSLIEKHGREKKCVVSSSSFSLLQKVNKLNPTIRTGLIVNTAFTSIYYEENFLSFYAINYSVLTPNISLYLHRKGKEVHCWTPNTRFAIKHAINTGADNIITDKVSLVKLLILAKEQK